jgi:hypothetical protein
MKKRIDYQDIVATALEVLGAAAVSYGAGLAYTPLGWLLGGLASIGVGISLAPKTPEAEVRRPEHR